MSLARLKRLQRLEARQPRCRPWTDPYDSCMRLWVDLQAVVAGRAEWLPRPARELSDEDRAAFELAMRTYDRIAERFAEQRRAAEEAKRRAKAERRAQRRAEAARAAEPAPTVEHGPPSESALAPAPRLPIEPAEPLPSVIVPAPRQTLLH